MAVQNLPPPSYPLQLVILAQAVCPHFSEYPLHGPALEIPMRRATRIVFPRKHLPLTTRTQNVENPIQDFARVCGGPPSWLLSSLGIGNVPFDLFPELIGNVSPTRPTRKRRSILLLRIVVPLPRGER